MYARTISRIFAWTVGTVALIGCASHSIVVTGESTNDNAEATRAVMQQIAAKESLGCQARAISGGPSVALGIVIGDACVDCVPQQQHKQRQVYVVNALMTCPGKGNAASN